MKTNKHILMDIVSALKEETPNASLFQYSIDDDYLHLTTMQNRKVDGNGDIKLLLKDKTEEDVVAIATRIIDAWGVICSNADEIYVGE